MEEITEEDGWLGACGSSACLVVKHVADVTYLRSTRDSKSLLTVTREEWLEFVQDIHEGKIT